MGITAAARPRTFDDFFRTEYPRLVAVAAALTGERESARDLAQEALLRCHRSWSRVGALDVPEAWVRRVLINLSIDHHRARRRTLRSAARQDIEPMMTLDDPAVDGWWSSVRALPDRQRAAVVLHYLEDRSIAEIAGVLDIAEGTVKASLSRARQTLARTLPKEDA